MAVEDLGNAAGLVLVHHVGRRYPGVLIQGDTLHALYQDLAEEAPDADVLQQVREWLTGYEQALDRLALELPYPVANRVSPAEAAKEPGAAHRPPGFEPARWQWVIDEVLPRAGMWVGLPTYERTWSWVQGFGATDSFLPGSQQWLSVMPEHEPVSNHGWNHLVLREALPNLHSRDLDEAQNAIAINHLRHRLLEYLQGPTYADGPTVVTIGPPDDGEWAYLRCQVVRQRDHDRAVVRLPNGSKTTIEARQLLRQSVRFGRPPQREDDRLVVGDIYEDCAYHPVLCTHVDYEADLIEGISLIDGSQPRSCSLNHCGVERLSIAEVISLRESPSTPTTANATDGSAEPWPGREATLKALSELQADLAANGADWENTTLPNYLEALQALLGSIENAYTNNGQRLPADPWAVIADALRGARFYE